MSTQTHSKPRLMSNPIALWRVCWAAEIQFDDGEVIPFQSYRSPQAIPRDEAEQRLAWGRRTYPFIIYWLERA